VSRTKANKRFIATVRESVGNSILRKQQSLKPGQVRQKNPDDSTMETSGKEIPTVQFAETTDEIQVYVHKDGRQSGPYAIGQLQELVNGRRFTGDDLAFYEGLDQWVKIAQVPGLRVPQVKSLEAPSEEAYEASSAMFEEISEKETNEADSIGDAFVDEVELGSVETKKKHSLPGFFLRIVLPFCLVPLFALCICDLLNQSMEWNIPIGLDLVGIQLNSTEERRPSEDKANMPLSFLGRKTKIEFDTSSNFISGFTLDGNKIATWQETANGVVSIWEVSATGSLTKLKSINSPDRTHDRATFGWSIILQGNFLGVGSILTWISQPHDGRFYVYDWKNNKKILGFNPQPVRAQRFGETSTISSDVFAVTEPGAGSATGATTFYSINGFETKQLQRYKIPGVLTNARGGSAYGDYFVTTFRARNAKPQKDFIKLWKVQRDAKGKATRIILSDSLETQTSENERYFGPAVINKNLLFVGTHELVVDGINSGSVYLFRILDSGKLKLLTKILPSKKIESMQFGLSLESNGDYLYVGAPNQRNGTKGTGRVYCFKINDDLSVNEIKTLSPDDLENGERFGDMINASKDLLAIRAGKNALYLFKKDL